jgi:hypothetical protein
MMGPSTKGVSTMAWLIANEHSSSEEMAVSTEDKSRTTKPTVKESSQQTSCSSKAIG